MSGLRFGYTFPVLAAALALGMALTAFSAGSVVLGSRPNGPFVDDGSELLAEATIPPNTAIASAQTVASGPIDNEVDLERDGGRLVYEIEVGETQVKVDAQDGSIVGTEVNDDRDDVSAEECDDTP